MTHNGRKLDPISRILLLSQSLLGMALTKNLKIVIQLNRDQKCCLVVECHV